MSSAIEIRVPNIGDFKDVPVIDVFVKPGDAVKPEDPLVALESDKATMDVPSPSAGTVESVVVKVGDKVSEGTAIIMLAPEGATAESPAPAASAQTAGGSVDVRVPNIGDFDNVLVIDVFVKPGDTVRVEDALITLESEKAAMDVPSPAGGVVRSVAIKPGDKVSEGDVILSLEEVASSAPAPAHNGSAPVRNDKTARAADAPATRNNGSPAREGSAVSAPKRPEPEPEPAAGGTPAFDATPPSNGALVHASPSIRRFARELGVDLHAVRGSGPHGRITREDVQSYVKSALAQPAQTAPATGGGYAFPVQLAPWPKVDFAQFGPIEEVDLSRIKRISGPNLARNWAVIPHVTNNDEADVTELEALRKTINAENPEAKLTMLAFAMVAVVAALKKFSIFNASLSGDKLIRKYYYNIGFAADTPNGLMVPVLKNADTKGVLQIASETRALAAKARDGKLSLGDMQGGTFTISSLGGIGGTSFSPIINAPEVSILGLSRAAMKPHWDGSAFVPRLFLPLSLSYDHRVIDGADAARFNAYLGQLLGDLRRAVL